MFTQNDFKLFDFAPVFDIKHAISLENAPQKGVAVSDFPEAKGIEIRQADDLRGAGAALLAFYRVWRCDSAFGLGIEDRKNSDFWVYMIFLLSVTFAA